MSRLEKYTVVELREKLKKAGLSTTGRKQELIDRLKENRNEGGNDQGSESSESESESEVHSSSEEEKKPQKRKPEQISKKDPSMVTIKVDETCNLSGASVFEDYGVTLNQVNIGNNNNKFYKIQILISGGKYYFFTRWGRVGEKGQNSCKGVSSLNDAKKQFCAKFREKTKNDWNEVKDNPGAFKSFSGLYTLLEMDDGDGEEEVEEIVEKKKPDSKKKVKPCTLPKETMSLIKLIFDHDMFKAQMQKFDLDVKKLPLGKISTTQINKGYEILDEIEEALDKGKESKLETLTNLFYTHIPHSFGRVRPPLIADAETVQKKRDMLAVLGDIGMAHSLTKGAEEGDGVVDHPLDANYKLLDTDLELLEQNSEEFKILEKYLNQTKNRPLEIIDIFKVNRHTEGKKFDVHEDIDNRRLLWHGTNVAVVVAILKSGLRIMPHSGGRVGRGIYFASENGKSANYVGPAGDIGIMFLNEVALGKEHIITQDDSTLREAPKGFDSIVAKGWTEPDPSKDITIKIDDNDVTVPQGKPIKIPEYAKSSFTHSEYLVYKESQCRIRYLLKLKWS